MNIQHSRAFQRLFLGLVVLLVLLVIVLVLLQRQKTADILFTYNGFTFRRDQYGYTITLYINAQKTPTTIHLREDPRTLEDIPVEGNIQLLRQKQQLYVTIDPYANLTGKTTIGALEIDAVVDNPYLFNIPVSSAFTEPYLNNTVKTCAAVSPTEGVILLQKGTSTVVREDKGCVTVQGVTEDDIIRAADRLVLTLLQVMKA